MAGQLTMGQVVAMIGVWQGRAQAAATEAGRISALVGGTVPEWFTSTMKAETFCSLIEQFNTVVGEASTAERKAAEVETTLNALFRTATGKWAVCAKDLRTAAKVVDEAIRQGDLVGDGNTSTNEIVAGLLSSAHAAARASVEAEQAAASARAAKKAIDETRNWR